MKNRFTIFLNNYHDSIGDLNTCGSHVVRHLGKWPPYWRLSLCPYRKSKIRYWCSRMQRDLLLLWSAQNMPKMLLVRTAMYDISFSINQKPSFPSFLNCVLSLSLSYFYYKNYITIFNCPPTYRCYDNENEYQ